MRSVRYTGSRQEAYVPVADGGISLTIPKGVNALIEAKDSFPYWLKILNI